MKADLNGVIKTAREALLCKSSSLNLLHNDEDSKAIKPIKLVKSVTSSIGNLENHENKEKRRLQNPLLNRLYHARNLVIHKMISTSLNSFKLYKNCRDENSIENKCCQLLILGAGIDISFEKLYSDTASIFTVDLPDIITERKKLLSRFYDSKRSNTDECNNYDSAYSDNSKRNANISDTNTKTNNSANNHIEDSKENNLSVSISGDLRDFSSFWDQLLLNGFQTNKPTIVLIECVLCYIDTNYVQILLQKLSENLCDQSLLVVYDPMLSSSSSDSFSPCSISKTFSNHPCSSSLIQKNQIYNNGFKKMMEDRFKERKAPIRHEIESTIQQIKFLKSCNWENVKCYTMQEALQSFLSKEERSVASSAESFDEYASLALLHKQYSVTLSALDQKLYQSVMDRLFHRTSLSDYHESNEHNKKCSSDCDVEKSNNTSNTISNTINDDPSDNNSNDNRKNNSNDSSNTNARNNCLNSNDDHCVGNLTKIYTHPTNLLNNLVGRISAVEKRIFILEKRTKLISAVTKNISLDKNIRLTIREANNYDSLPISDLFKEVQFS
jgi:O-methyltransferase involved in polyketide biosynthesis